MKTYGLDDQMTEDRNVWSEMVETVDTFRPLRHAMYNTEVRRRKTRATVQCALLF